MLALLSVAWMVKLKRPATVGVPVIAPLWASSVSPVGNEPAVTAKV